MTPSEQAIALIDTLLAGSSGMALVPLKLANGDTVLQEGARLMDTLLDIRNLCATQRGLDDVQRMLDEIDAEEV